MTAVPAIVHVSDGRPRSSMSPRPAPPGTPHQGRRLGWAVDDNHLAHDVVPRDCPVVQGGEFSVVRIRNAGRDQMDERPTRS